MNDGKEIVVSLRNLESNINVLKNKVSENTKIVATLKADAYGHGLVKVFKFLIFKGIDYFGISSINDIKKLRKINNSVNILLYIRISKNQIKNLFRLNVIPFVSDKDYLNLLEDEAKKQNKKIKVHLKVDVGMNRYGVRIEEALELALFIKKSRFVELDGICTHLSSTEDKEVTNNNIHKFLNFLELAEKNEISLRFIHASNSGHIINYELSKKLNMIRPGLALYGYSPVNSDKKNHNLIPLLSMYSRVMFLKNVKKDEKISYSGLFTAEKDMIVGIVNVGYFDGIPQNFQEEHYFLINGKRCKILGKVCMNITIIEIPKELNIKVEQKVEIISENLNLVLMSKASRRSIYELLCTIGKYQKRKYLY